MVNVEEWVALEGGLVPSSNRAASPEESRPHNSPPITKVYFFTLTAFFLALFPFYLCQNMYSSAILRSTVVGLVLCAQGLAAPSIINREAQGSEPDPNVLKEPICTTYNKGFIDFVVNMHGWGTNEKGCGEGLLDNMHGENGLVHDWTCDGKGGNLTQAKFSLPPTIDTAATKSPGRIVNEAIQKASFGVLDPNVDFCS